MRYALKNTILLGVLWLAVLAAGIGTERLRAKEFLRLKGRERQVQAKLDEVTGYLAIYEGVQRTLEKVRTRWQNQPRTLMSEDTSARTFAYLNDILEMPEAFIKFDFTYVGRVDSTKFSHNTYTLSGEGDFPNLAAFIWYLEHTRGFYAVSSLEVTGSAGLRVLEDKTPTEEYEQDRAHFNITFRAYFSPITEIRDTLFLPDEDPAWLPLNPFRPLIFQDLPPNLRGLFEVPGARLQGVGYRRAFLVDQGGKLHILREGDRVYLGVLSRVDQALNRAEFLLDKGGIPERVVLEVKLGGGK